MAKVYKKGFGFVDSSDEIVKLTPTKIVKANDTPKKKRNNKGSANVKRVITNNDAE